MIDAPISAGELIQMSVAAAGAAPEWLCSEEHRRLLERYVQSRAEVKSLVWGATSDWERVSKVITLAKPDAVETPETNARRLALNAFHESLHARYSNDPSAADFFKNIKRLQALGNVGGAFLSVVFNTLEDERIMHRELMASRQDEQEMELFRDEVITQRAAEYYDRHGTAVWTVPAADRGDQFMVALATTVHRPSAVGTVDEPVARLLSQAKPHVDAAITGSMRDAIAQTYDILQLFRDALSGLVEN